jgi:hypothetical protein
LRLELEAREREQRRGLEAESDRLALQLAAEDEKVERAALRDVLDDALVVARTAYLVIWTEHRNHDFGPEAGEHFEAELGGRVGMAGSRLTIRLSRSHPVTESYALLRDELLAYGEQVARPMGCNETDEERSARCDDFMDPCRIGLRTFADRAYTLARSPTGSSGKLDQH